MKSKYTIQDREYQTTDRGNIELAWKEVDRVLYQLACGGGKSVVMKGIMKDCQGEDQIIFAHKKKLIKQLEEHLTSIGMKPGILTGTRKENLDAKIVIASIRTAVKDKNLTMLLQRKWTRAYIDEARHSRTASYDTVLGSLTETLPGIKILGVDATPYRKDKKRLDRWFQMLVISVEDVKSLQEKGYLAAMRTYATPLKDMEEEVEEVAGDYKKEQLSKFMRKPMYLNYVVQNYIKRGEGRQAIGFAVDIQHAKDLVEVFKKNGIKNVAAVSSENTEEEIDTIFEQYESGKIQVLWNVEMITEGVDLPETRCIIGARPTKSLTLYLQMAMRGTRPKDGGGDCIMLDCCGWTNGTSEKDTGFGTIDSPKHWSLNPEIDPNNPRKKNKIVGKKDDGTFTEEIGEFDELVEMTPQEYMQHLSGGLEKAEKHNLTIEEQIKSVQIRMNELLSKVPKTKGKSEFDQVSFIDEDDLLIVATWFLKKNRKGERKTAVDDCMDDSDAPFDTYNTPYARLVIGAQRPLYSFLTAYRADDHTKASAGLTAYIKTCMLCADINEQLLDAKSTIKQLYEMYEEILDLKKSKINIKEIQAASAKFQEEEWMKKVNQAVKDEQWLMLEHDLAEDDFFKGGRYGYNRILGIKVLGNQVNAHHNKVIVKTEYRGYRWRERGGKEEPVETEKNYVKGEKVWEILKAGKYDPTKINKHEKVPA